ncbi:MAG: inositol monophosphatase [Candidatus Diapherotrites archaeon CG11_big_fil_rev_8_21_14_0_20_37_9]|nr:MAG: inositol monophosphatase [Candidatus Diapherotrites archaeon CG11_big_fil_rev_8_21_14_0_20_37_9]
MLEFAKKIAVQAGKKHIMAFNRHKFKVNYKSKFNPVTKQDKSVETYLQRSISEKYPSHGIIGEEGTSKKGTNGFTWVIDPLDGTINFIRGFPYFTVSIGIMKNDKPHIGVIYNPVSKELFYAERGEGAFMNNSKIHVSKTFNIGEAYFSTGFRYKRGKGFINPLKKIRTVLEKSMVVRRTGSASMDLCNVAKGTFDGFFMYDSKKWDVLAGVTIVKEAGGKFDLKDKQRENNVDVIATNSRLNGQLKKILGWT